MMSYTHLLAAFFLVLTRTNVSTGNNNHILYGYNILTGNPFAETKTRDPGYALQIFDKNNRVIRNNPPMCCELHPLKLVSTSESYRSLMIGKKNTADETDEFPITLAGLSKNSLFERNAFLRNGDFISNEKLFVHRRGVLILKEYTCTLFTVRLSDSVRTFSKQFLQVLRLLNQTSNDGDENDKLTAFYRFIDHFGTHFIKKVDIGARFVLNQRYKRNEYQSISRKIFQDCANEKFNQFFEPQPPLGHCEEITYDDYLDGLKRTYYTSIGSNKSTEDWEHKQFNKPEPIKITLVSMLELFTNDVMKKYNINSEKILKWFSKLYYSYCRGGSEVAERDKYCGIKDTCVIKTQTCAETESYYKCCRIPFEGQHCFMDEQIEDQEEKYINVTNHESFVKYLRKSLEPKYPLKEFFYFSFNLPTQWAANGILYYHSHGRFNRNLIVSWRNKNSSLPNLRRLWFPIIKSIIYKGCRTLWVVTQVKRVVDKVAPGALNLVLVFEHDDGFIKKTTGTIVQTYPCRKYPRERLHIALVFS